jgi:hypothetical protein
MCGLTGCCLFQSATPAGRPCRSFDSAGSCDRMFATLRGQSSKGQRLTDDLPQQPEQERRFRRRPMCCLLSLFCGSAT